jgi:hypothetical protein
MPMTAGPCRLAGVLLLATLCSAGCDINEAILSELEHRGEHESGIEHEIFFRVAEEHESPANPGEPKLFFTMRTRDSLPCFNYEIFHTVERSGDAIFVRALDTGLPGSVCLTAFGPATARFELPLEQGIYRLVLLNGQLQDSYTLRVSDQYVEVEAVDTSWTQPVSARQWYYPRNSFAYYCGTTPDARSLCSDFESLLQDLPLTRLAVPDQGQWPYSLELRGYSYNAPGQFYGYPDEATWEEVKRRLRGFTEEHLRDREGVGMVVENWLFDEVRSWSVLEGE